MPQTQPTTLRFYSNSETRISNVRCNVPKVSNNMLSLAVLGQSLSLCSLGAAYFYINNLLSDLSHFNKLPKTIG